jgi:hypothetical protein
MEQQPVRDSGREYFCFVWRRGNRVHHWHWPKKDIVNCKNAIGVTRPGPPSVTEEK